MSGRRKKLVIYWTPEKIRQLRIDYGESQNQFRTRLGVTVDALRGWEQNRGQPSGSAQILLSRLEEDLNEGKIRSLQTA